MLNQSLTESINGIALEVELLKGEVAKFDGGNNAAGVRARNTLQKVKISCGEIRAAILDVAKTRKTAPAPTPVASTNGKLADATKAEAPKVAAAATKA